MYSSLFSMKYSRLSWRSILSCRSHYVTSVQQFLNVVIEHLDKVTTFYSNLAMIKLKLIIPSAFVARGFPAKLVRIFSKLKDQIRPEIQR